MKDLNYQLRTLCRLRWDWEVEIPASKTSVFILPADVTKTSIERVVVLNAVAHRVIESRRGMHENFVFTYRGRPIRKLHSSAWKRAWKKAGKTATVAQLSVRCTTAHN